MNVHRPVYKSIGFLAATVSIACCFRMAGLIESYRGGTSAKRGWLPKRKYRSKGYWQRTELDENSYHFNNDPTYFLA